MFSSYLPAHRAQHMVPLSPDTLGHQSLNSLNLKIPSIIASARSHLLPVLGFFFSIIKLLIIIIKILVLSSWKRKDVIPPFLIPVPTSLKGQPQERLSTAATGRFCTCPSTPMVETDAKARCLHEAGGLEPGSLPALNWSLVHQGCVECMWDRGGLFCNH